MKAIHSINELIIGTGSKDRFSVDDPKNDGQFASYFLDPLLAKLYSTILGIPVPQRLVLTCFPWFNTWLRFAQGAAPRTRVRSPTCYG